MGLEKAGVCFMSPGLSILNFFLVVIDAFINYALSDFTLEKVQI
jgi:hypothetical protein